MLEYRAILQKAFAGEVVTISCEDSLSAINLRQKFYRYRDKIRNSSDGLNLVVDGLLFGVDRNNLVITYQDRENLMEALNDDLDTGERSLKHKTNRNDSASSQGSVSKDN